MKYPSKLPKPDSSQKISKFFKKLKICKISLNLKMLENLENQNLENLETFLENCVTEDGYFVYEILGF